MTKKANGSPFEDHEPQLLWRQEAISFVVEMHVGTVWVEHSRADVMSAAKEQAETALREKAVKAVRVNELALRKSYSVIWGEKQDALLRIPSKMKLTDRQEPCPRCDAISSVAFDGKDHWLFCAPCKGALPIAS